MTNQQNINETFQKSNWIEIRDSFGHLLFLYDPFENTIEIRRNGVVCDFVRLNVLREKCGIILVSKTEPLDVVEIPGKKI